MLRALTRRLLKLLLWLILASATAVRPVRHMLMMFGDLRLRLEAAASLVSPSRSQLASMNLDMGEGTAH